MFGLFNVNKPTGVTSRDVVNHIQRLVRPSKVGHAGTLDPLATGVLVVCVGPATRLIEYIQRLPKRYRAQFTLGCVSDTEDTDGHVQPLNHPPRPSVEQIQHALPAFTGEILQRPPAYSAVKISGQRAYKLARSGRRVELEARPVWIQQLGLAGYEYPLLTLDVVCGSGTYIRSLGRDLAVALGTGAVMNALERTAIGKFDVASATDLDALGAGTLQQHLLPASIAVEHLPRVELTTEQQVEISHGRKVRGFDVQADQEIAAVDRSGQLVAILRVTDRDWLQPVRYFG